MINLLPADAKREIAAGRANRLLLRYLILFIALALVLVAAIGLVYMFLQNTYASEQDKKQESENSSRQLLARRQEVEAFRSDLATAKQILDKQINYSSIILRVAGAIPDGVVISDITLDPKTIGTPTKLNAEARSEARLKALKDSLNSSPYFDDVYYDSVTKQSGKYPYAAILTVTFKQELLQ